MSVELERDLVADCRQAAKAMNVYLEVCGQRKAKGSGTTVGFPDAVLYVAGQTRLIEFKRPKLGALSVGQQVAMEQRLEQGVKTYVVETLEEFCAIVNEARRA